MLCNLYHIYISRNRKYIFLIFEKERRVMVKISSNRETNFELIRIFAMLMIIGSHLAIHGVMHSLPGGSVG